MRSGYDENSGRVKSITYPNGIKVATAYNARGYATQSYNVASSYVYHQVTGMSAQLQVTDAQKANGILTELTDYHPEKGQMEAIYTHATIGGVNPQRYKIDYVYEGFGNLAHQTIESNWSTGVDRKIKADRHYLVNLLQPFKWFTRHCLIDPVKLIQNKGASSDSTPPKN